MTRITPRLLAAAWGLARTRIDRLFAPGAGTALSEIQGWSRLGLSRAAIDEQSVTALDALRAIALVTRAAHGADDADRAELVCTLPSPDRGVLTTRDVAIDLIERAKQEIVLLGFDVADRILVEALARRSRDGVAVLLVGDQRAAWATAVRRGWPPVLPLPRCLQNVEPSESDPRLMHAKVIVCDRRIALVGSANFTRSGFGRNLEFGVRVQGRVAAEIVRTVERLEREGWLVRAPS